MSDNNIEQIEGIIKWYNPNKGFGFVIKDEDTPDIFLHFSALDAVGLSNINEGSSIVCDIAKNWNGLQVLKIYEIKFNHSSYNENYESYNVKQITGEVKWYNAMKGFGFIFSDEDRSEIFLHSSILHPAMYQDLIPGRKVSVLYIESERGKEAKEIKFL